MSWVVVAVQTTVTARAGESLLYLLRVRSYAHLQRLGLDYYERELSGRIMTRMTTDVDALSSFLQTGLAQAVVSLLTVGGVAVALMVTDPELALVALAALPILVAATLRFRVLSSRAYAEARERVAVVNADMQENVTGVRVAQAFTRERHSSAVFGDRSLAYRRSRLRAQRYIASFFPFVALLSDLATAAVLGVGAARVASGALTPGVLTAFLLYLGLFFAPVQQLSQVFDGYQQARIGLRRIGDLLRTPTTVPDEGTLDGASPAARRGGAARRRLLLRRRGPRPRSTGCRCRWRRGRRSRWSAPRGQASRRWSSSSPGSTTRARAACSSTAWTSGGTGWPPSATGSGSSRRRRTCSPETSRRTSPTGARTPRPPRSRPRRARSGRSTWSGGCPRASARPSASGGRGCRRGSASSSRWPGPSSSSPDLLLFDEATAALDPATEAAVLAAGDRVTRGGPGGRRTAFVVAHRLATAARADRVVVLHGGRIAEQGPPAELLARDGRFTRLVAGRRAGTRRERGGWRRR